MKWPVIAAFVLGFAASPVFMFGYASVAAHWLERDFDAWARHEAAFEMTRSLNAAVERYRRDHHRVPAEAEGLAALVPQYQRDIPPDPWGTPFVYRTQGGDWADIVSLGADARPGGHGPATDVSARYGSPGTSTSRLLAHSYFAFLLLLPVAVFAFSFVRQSATAALAGVALFWAWTVAATVAPNANVSIALAAAFTAIVTATTGAVLSLRQQQGGTACALAGTLGCQITTAVLIG